MISASGVLYVPSEAYPHAADVFEKSAPVISEGDGSYAAGNHSGQLSDPSAAGQRRGRQRIFVYAFAHRAILGTEDPGRKMGKRQA